MQRKNVSDFTNTRTSRVDRFAQMSKVEQVIEQKKREIQARLNKNETSSDIKTTNLEETQLNSNNTKPKAESDNAERKNDPGVNIFSNDGSFLDQFKQLSKDKSIPATTTTSTPAKRKTESDDSSEKSDGNYSDRRNSERSNKSSRWSSSSRRDDNYNNYPSKSSRYTNEKSRYENNSGGNSYYNSSKNYHNTNNKYGQEKLNYPPPLMAEPILPLSANIPNKSNVQQRQIDIPVTSVFKNIPPPNKSIPPPQYPSNSITYPPPLSQMENKFSSTSGIPSLMAQPILPPVGMNIPQRHMPSHNAIPPLLAVAQAPPPPPPPPPSAQLGGALSNSGSQMLPITIPPPNLLTSSNNNSEHCLMRCEVCPVGSESHAAMSSVARMVAQCGVSFEDAVRQRSRQDPNMWFLYDTNSTAYKQYQDLVNQFKSDLATTGNEYKPEDLYEPDNVSNNGESNSEDAEDKSYERERREKRGNSFSSDSDDTDNNEQVKRRRKRKSRWGDQMNIPPPTVLSAGGASGVGTLALPPQVTPLNTNVNKNSVMLTKVTRNDPALIQYAINTFGSINLSEEDWQKAEDHYKINLLYQDMLKKRQELERMQRAGKFKYEYDSDEEVDGGTWEHKLRMQEMEATKLWATELTKKAEGKHHIGDFLPPEELRKFLEQSTAAKEGREPDLSDYKEYKLKSDNIGFKMLQKLGWSEGQGLGAEGSGIVEPVNKALQRDSNQGLGLNVPGNLNGNDDEYDAYRKRMMLAYRFRPNPLNNPRRPYY